MHKAALRGGPAEGFIQPGWLMAGGGIIAVLGLRTTPGVYPALSLLLAGIAAGLAPRLQARYPNRPAPATVLYTSVAAPLVLGVPAALSAQPGALRWAWLAVFAAVGWLLWRAAGELLLQLEHLACIRTLPPAALAEYACRLVSSRGSSSARAGLLMLAVERLLGDGVVRPAGELLNQVPVRKRSHAERRAQRLRSAVALMEGDLEGARDLAQGLLGEPLDLEEVRQYRAWAAYVELASGCPRSAAELAAAAVGPQSMAGEAWIEHCGALQAWALHEQGYDAECLELVRFLLANSRPGSPGAPALHAIAARVHLHRGENEPAAKHLRGALAGAKPEEPDSFVLGAQCVWLGAAANAEGLVEAAERTLARAHGPFAGAMAHADIASGWLNVDEGVRAEAAFRRALNLWPTLPSACEGLAASLALQGRHDEAERIRTDGARLYPQHRVALQK